MRPTRTTIAPLAAVLAAATLATPATAAPIDSPAHRQHTESTIPPAQDLLSLDAHHAALAQRRHSSSTKRRRPAQDLRSPDTRDAAAGRGTFNAPDVTVIKLPQSASSPHGGVDWADAAIGAGGATGLLAISLAGAMTLRRRQRGPRSRAAIT
jgi:type IV secretory pathway TrbL component